MVYNVIINRDIKQYQPQFYFSKVLDIESVNIDKYDKVYLMIDDLNIFKNNITLFNPSKVIFVYDKNIKFDMISDLNVKIVNFFNDDVKFIKKIIKHGFIEEYFKL